MKRIVIGTRGSDLALWQANHVRDGLLAAHDGLDVELTVVQTKGDRALETPLHKMLDKGLFTKEIESALLAGTVDLAVHSLKDLPTALPPGLALAAVTPREDPADMLVARRGDRENRDSHPFSSDSALDNTETTEGKRVTVPIFSRLPRGAAVLTGSLRRTAQLLAARPDLEIRPVRGNVATRLRKLDESDAAATILARAGLKRLGLLDRSAARLDPAAFLPACGQGALGIEIRDGDQALADLLAPLNDATTRAAVTAERTFLADLGGGCQAPFGAYARLADDGATFEINGMVASLDGQQLLQRALSMPTGEVEDGKPLGRALAAALREAGCMDILNDIASPPPAGPQEHTT